MANRDPSYQRPTRASLGRIVFKPEPIDKKTLNEKQIAWRKIATKQRLDTADKLRQGLAPAEKWPTVNGVKSHRQRLLQSKTVAKKDDLHIVSPTNINKTSITEAWSSKFPIPIRTSKDRTTFPQFSLLPAELRVLIWEIAIYVSKLIELNYFLSDTVAWTPYTYSQASSAQFINYQRYDVLNAVCLESREVAQRFLSPRRLSYLQIIDLDGGAMPNPRPVFSPRRDTIFFRAMGHSIANEPKEIYLNGMGQLRHIAIPFEMKKLVRQSSFSTLSMRFPNLQTLTLVLGCEEKSHRGDPSIELRNLDEWFADGRPRTAKVVNGDHIRRAAPTQAELVTLRDVAELPTIISRWAQTRPGSSIAVRIVAWKRTVS